MTILSAETGQKQNLINFIVRALNLRAGERESTIKRKLKIEKLKRYQRAQRQKGQFTLSVQLFEKCVAALQTAIEKDISQSHYPPKSPLSSGTADRAKKAIQKEIEKRASLLRTHLISCRTDHELSDNNSRDI